MTAFVGVGDMVRWLGARGPAAAIRGIAARLEDDLRRWSSFEKRERVASHATPPGPDEQSDETHRHGDDDRERALAGHARTPGAASSAPSATVTVPWCSVQRTSPGSSRLR